LWLGTAGLLAIGVTFAALHAVQVDQETWVIRTREISRIARNGRSYAIERLAGVRGLIITGDLKAIGAEIAAHRALGPAIDSLITLTGHNPTQQARARTIQASLKAWDEQYLAIAVRNLRARARGEATEPQSDVIGASLFAPVRAAFDAFVAEEERLFAERLATARRSERIVLVAVLTELLLLGGVLAWVMRRSLGQARQVVQQQEQLEEGAVEMEMQSAELGEQAVELEEQMHNARTAAVELARTNADLTRSIAERAHAATELVSQQHFLRQVIDTIPHFVFAKDRLGRFTLVNQAVATAYGTTPETLIGKSDADFNPNPEQVAAFLHDDLAVMDSLSIRHIPEESITDASGATRWLQTVKRALPNREGTGHQILGVSTDITERRQLEKQLLQSQKMEAVGRLAGGVAHDFNNLLTVISSYADLLLVDLESARHRADVEEIRQAAERASALTRQLLAFSRKQVMQPTTLSPNAVVAGMEKMLGRLIGADVELVTALPLDVGMVDADAGQLEQVIMNLAVNARDAMPDGGRITIETSNVELAEADASKGRAITAGAYVMLAISDTGVGMGPEVLAHLFEPFFTTKATGQGTGLGLSTVFGIVRQSGGDVWVYSEVGEGTTVKIYLPRVASSPAIAEEIVVESSPRGAETILLAEDDDALRNLALRVLRGQGYTVLEARNGREALGLCASHRGSIDLILSDIIMPEIGGRALAEGIAATRPRTRVLFMSGYTNDDVLRRALIDQRTAFLQKPFTPVTLAKRVREVLDAGRE
jgi:PAS domain S-box-containing protein